MGAAIWRREDQHWQRLIEEPRGHPQQGAAAGISPADGQVHLAWPADWRELPYGRQRRAGGT